VPLCSASDLSLVLLLALAQVEACPRRRQTLLFSATLTSGVERLVSLSLAHPVRLSADPATQRPKTLAEE